MGTLFNLFVNIFTDLSNFDKIEQILFNDPPLWEEFTEKKRLDEDFRNSEREQLNFIYKRSGYFEDNTFKVLPVFYQP